MAKMRRFDKVVSKTAVLSRPKSAGIMPAFIAARATYALLKHEIQQITTLGKEMQSRLLLERKIIIHKQLQTTLVVNLKT